MGKNSKIAWTHHTFNPWWGCVKVSPGCQRCYAESFDKRCGPSHWGGSVPRRMFGAKHWDEPYDWDAAAQGYQRERVFCGSMCDILENRPELQSSRDRVWQMVEDTQWLDWLILTKRPENFGPMLPAEWRNAPPSNFWPMTTVENADYLWRVDHLLSVPATVHGLSLEPLLGPMPTLGEHLDGIDWVIVGAESNGGRPMDEDWVRSIRDQCLNTNTAFFYKQNVVGRTKIETPELDGVRWMQMPEDQPNV